MEQEPITEPKPGEVILRVSLRPRWLQWIPAPLHSEEVTRRMFEQARVSLKQFKNADHVIVTVADEHGETRELLQGRSLGEPTDSVSLADYLELSRKYEEVSRQLVELQLVLEALQHGTYLRP